MGEIYVEGIGTVQIQGDTPSPEEEAAIMGAMTAPPQEPHGAPTSMQAAGWEYSDEAKQSEPFVPPQGSGMEGLERGSQGYLTRDAFTAGGATVGGALAGGVALPTGPGALATATGGATLGAAAGSLTYDVLDSLYRMATKEPPRGEGPLEPSKRALGEATLEAGFTTAAMGLGPVFSTLKSGTRRVLGVAGEESKELARTAGNVPLGIIHASESSGVKGIPKVIGVFPFVGTPYKQSAKAIEGTVEKNFDDILNTLAPNATIADLGVDLTEAAKGRFKKFRTVTGAMYDRFYDYADSLSRTDVFPTRIGDDGVFGVAEVAESVTEGTAKGRILLRSGKALPKPGKDDFVGDFINDLKDLPDYLDANQIRQLQRDLQEAMTVAQKEGYDISRLVKIKKGLEATLNAPDLSLLPADEAAELVGRLTSANEFYANGIKPFQTATGKKFGRVDKNIFGFGPSAAGSINEDQVFKAVFEARSPQAIADLRDLVGKNKMAEATRKHLDLAFQSSLRTDATKTLPFSPDMFAKKIGLDTADGRQALDAMLEGTGLTTKTLDKFMSVSRAAASAPVSDPSSFLKRRLTLGGLRSMVTLGAAYAGLHNPIMTASGVLLARYGGRLLTEPQYLEALLRAADETLPTAQRRALIMRVGRHLLDEE